MLPLSGYFGPKIYVHPELRKKESSQGTRGNRKQIAEAEMKERKDVGVDLCYKVAVTVNNR
jgi:hypothetical protein